VVTAIARGPNGCISISQNPAAIIYNTDRTKLTGMLPMGRGLFVPLITTVVAIVTGAALFATACRGIWALSVHIQRGDTSSALSVGLLSIAAFVVSLLFLMPSALRHIIELGGKPGYRGPITFGASLVLFAVLLASAGAERQPGNLVFGILTRASFAALVLTYSVLFLIVFIYPGYAYPARQRDEPTVPAPKPRIVQGLDHIKSPWLRGAIRITGIGYLMLLGFAFYAHQFAHVIPEPAIVEANRRYLILTCLLTLLPLGALLAAHPISDGSTLTDHFRAKVFPLLGIGLIHGLACIVLPERGLPIVANALLEAKLEIQSFQVTSAKPKSGLRGCGAKMVILLNPETGRNYDLCRVPVKIAERAKSGDLLDVLGKSSGFGLTIEGFKLRQVQASASPMSNTFARLDRQSQRPRSRCTGSALQVRLPLAAS
jgi:hypothetical protein